MPRVKFFIKQLVKIGMQKIVLPMAYAYFSKKQVIDKQTIVFADAHHTTLPASMKLIERGIKDRGFHVVYHCRDYSKMSARAVLCSMISFMDLYSRARCVIICDNFLPVASCRKRRGTIVIQLWHAAGALKKFGYDSVDDIPSWYLGNVYKNYDLVTVSGKVCVKPFANAMKLPVQKVKPLGVSRTDKYFDLNYLRECRKRFYEKYPEAYNKKVVLWAPTFRGNLTDPTVTGEEEIKKLEELLGAEWGLVIKFHPHMHTHPHTIFDFFPTEELLPVIDFLITDYSSIIFDYLLFDKPFAFFVPDLETYVSKRGLYMSLNDFPGRKARNAEELYQAITENWDDERFERLHACREMYMEACDGKATERILKEIGF